MLDAVELEKRGLPTAVVHTDAFDNSAYAAAESSGVPWYPFAVIEHPISSRSEEELDRLARSVCDRVEQLLIQPLQETEESQVSGKSPVH